MTQGAGRLYPGPIPVPGQKSEHRYNLHCRYENKDKSPPTPEPSKAPPTKSPTGKVVIRTHGILKKQVKVWVLKCHLCHS